MRDYWLLQKKKKKSAKLFNTSSSYVIKEEIGLINKWFTNLGSLANYGTESEASEVEEDKDGTDSEEELHRRIREKKKLFAIKEKKIIAELERKEIEQHEALQTKNGICMIFFLCQEV